MLGCIVSNFSFGGSAPPPPPAAAAAVGASFSSYFPLSSCSFNDTASVAASFFSYFFVGSVGVGTGGSCGSSSSSNSTFRRLCMAAAVDRIEGIFVVIFVVDGSIAYW